VATQRTLCIIKPDAVAANKEGAILDAVLSNGFQVLSLKRMRLSEEQARAFYAVHHARPFFQALVSFMCSGPIVVAALSAEDAVSRYRTLIGATDPAKAADGTVRKKYGTDVERNAVHGSDSPDNGLRDPGFVVSGIELGVSLD
jgi:nucleoside-diphosphate kinase